MNARWTAIAVILLAGYTGANAQSADPRLREITYDARTVVTVPVKRGVVALIVLDAGESIAEIAAGLGSDCSKVDATWCIAAQPGGRTLFVKAKGSASAANTIAVVTDKRTHSFRFVVLRDDDAREPVYRLVVRTPAPPALPRPSPRVEGLPLPALPSLPPQIDPATLVADRLSAKAAMTNTSYSVAEGASSSAIVPSLVFDDGRFTYLKFAGNRQVPAVFDVLDDGSEELVNTRMEDDFLVVDRVSRRLALRASQAVVGIWNDAFDAEGLSPTGGTTVPGLQRILKAHAAATKADHHD